MLKRSNMENLSEKLSFMDEEITFQEDSTASSSSLATALSEEDDLRLGAEANSFVLDKNGSNLKARRPEYFVVKKHYKEREYQMSRRTYSTISSIKDLLNARDCDAEEVLFNLGFASNNGQDSRESILSRFETPEQGSPLEPTQSSQQASGASSITKTREWLEKHEGNSEIGSYLKSMESKSRQNSTTSNDFGGTYQPKRQKSRPNTLRKKWSSKSRQSSFDRLPNLKEEDPVAEERKSLSGPEILTRSASPLVKSSAFDNVKSIKIGSSNYIDSGQSHVVSLINQHKGSAGGGGNSFKAIVSSKTMQTVTNSNLPGNSLQHVLMKNLKSTELKEAQTDSFELEEIMSSDGHLEESTNKVSNKFSLVDNHRRRRQGVVANPFNRTEVTTTPTSIASDASSGFCEPTDHHTKYKTILPIVSQSETDANTQRSLVNAVAKKFHGNFKTIESLENAFKSYCDDKAKIICASATAKAAIKLRSRAHTKKMAIDTCKNLNIFSNFMDRSKGKATSKFHCEEGNVLTNPLYRCYSTEALKVSKCSRHQQPKHSFSYNQNARINTNIQKLTRFHSLPQLNFTLPESFDKSTSLMSSISEVSASALSTRHKQYANFRESKKIKKMTLKTKEDLPKDYDEMSKCKGVREWENIDFKTEQCPECRKNVNLSFEHKDEDPHLTGVLKHDGNIMNNNFVNNEDVERMKVMNMLTFDSNEDKGKREIKSPVPSSVVDKLSASADLSHLFPIKDVSVTVNGHS